jgi:hypothetical protein
MAIGATGTALAPTISSGLGNIQAAIGTPNASGGAGALNGIARPPGPMMGTFGNIGSTMQQTPAQPAQPAQNSGGIGAIMARMDPQHAAAIRGIPQQAMQALHSAGMIHPALMQHLYGQQQ